MGIRAVLRMYSEPSAKSVAKKAPLFRSMSRSTLSQLIERSGKGVYRANDVIVRQGEREDIVYLVLTGRVRVTQARGDTASEVIVAELGPGEVFGELAALEAQPRSATVLALEPTSCLKVSGQDFLAALSESTS